MRHQVIVADDSQTIQKVISITLASEPFDIVECLDVKNLTNLVSVNSPKIILLDFNLSEDKTGYDLCKEIKEISPESFVVFLFGTFDTIDEELIDQCKASNWIVKPFDGNKFINLCRNIIDNDTSISSQDSAEDETEEWVMDVPSQIEDEELPSFDENSNRIDNKLNVLENSMQEWGIEIPSIIGQESQNLSDIPNVIGQSDLKLKVDAKSRSVDSSSSDEHVFPESSDLEYPEIIEFENKPKIELTPIHDLKIEEVVPQDIENKLFSTNSSKTDVQSLKAQIEDEADDLWQLDQDDSPSGSADNSKDEKSNLNVHLLHDTPSDFPTDVMEDEEDISFVQSRPIEIKENPVQSLNTDEIIEKLRPIIEEIVRAECKKIAEKVSWEIIPDLAENLIKDELRKISNQVLDQ